MPLRSFKNQSKRIQDLRKRVERLGLTGALRTYVKAEKAFYEYAEALLDADEAGDSEQVARLARTASSIFRMIDNAHYILEPQLKKQIRRMNNNQKSKELLEDIFDKHEV